jgi:hypothetical protein
MSKTVRPSLRASFVSSVFALALLALGCDSKPNADVARGDVAHEPELANPESARPAPPKPEPQLDPPLSPRAQPPIQPPSAGAGIEDERNTISVFEAAGPATVFVTQSQAVRNRFTARVDQLPAGSGSGFIWDP